MAFQLFSDQAALKKLHCPKFQKQWRELITLCPWSTLFQGIDFTQTWLEVYRDDYTPILMMEENSNGGLDHLLILGYNKRNNQLFHSGAHQAEYQCWLSKDLDFSNFITQMLLEIKKITSSEIFTLKFLSPVLTQQIKDNPKILSNHFILREEKKPVIQFDKTPPPWKSMSKKGNKSKLSRLRKVGDFTLELMAFDTGSKKEEAVALLKQVALFYDLRQGAISNAKPFIEDKNKFDFYVRLLTKSNEFQILAIRMDDRLVACVIGPVTEEEFSVSVFSYDIFLSKHSPGKLLLLMGSELLAERGLKSIDLTPGGDWKWRYANDTETVSEITLYNKASPYYKDIFKKSVSKKIKGFLKILGITPDHIRNFVTLMRKITLSRISNKIKAFITPKRIKEFRVYSFPIEKIELLSEVEGINCNAISDFLKFQSSEIWHQQQDFLSSSLRRFETGSHGYSHADDERLLHSGWLAPMQKESYFSEVGQKYTYPEPGSVLFDFYTHPDARGRGLYQKTITRILKDIAKNSEIKTIYIGVLADNKASRHVIEKVGFQYLESIYSKK